MRSDIVKKGPSRAPHRSLFKAAGLTEEEIERPLIGVVTGGIDFSGLIITVGESQILVGNFINAIISFLLVSISVFMLVKFMNMLKKKEEEKPTPAPKPSNEEILLTEIRDILKEHK